LSISRFVNKDGVEINISPYIYRAVSNGRIAADVIMSENGKRLDHYAYEAYGDSSLWWVIAAASNIGWWLQVPAGIRLYIPKNINDIVELKGLI